MDKNLIKKGHLFALMTVFIWSNGGISSKVLLTTFNPIELFFYRMMIAYIALLVIKPGFIRYKNIKEELTFIAAGITGVTLFFIAQNIALIYTFASNVGVLLTISPFFTAVLSYFFLKDEKLQPKFFAGFAITIVGIFLIAYNGNQVLKLNPLGDILALVASFSWGVYSVVMKKISAYNYSTIHSTRKIFFYGLIFLIPVLIYTDFHFSITKFYSMSVLLNMLYLGIGASAVTYVSWNYAVSIIGAVKTSVYLYATPILTMIMAFIILKERITLVAIAGVALILTGIYFSERKSKDFELKKAEQENVNL